MPLHRFGHALTLTAALTMAGAAVAEAQIVSPTHDETIHSNAGHVRVVVQAVPRGWQLQPVLDGVAMGKPVPGSVVHLRGVSRGTHELTVKLLDAHGREAAQTPPVTFHVWQASRLFPNRQR